MSRWSGLALPFQLSCGFNRPRLADDPDGVTRHYWQRVGDRDVMWRLSKRAGFCPRRGAHRQCFTSPCSVRWGKRAGRDMSGQTDGHLGRNVVVRPNQRATRHSWLELDHMHGLRRVDAGSDPRTLLVRCVGHRRLLGMDRDDDRLPHSPWRYEVLLAERGEDATIGGNIPKTWSSSQLPCVFVLEFN